MAEEREIADVLISGEVSGGASRDEEGDVGGAGGRVDVEVVGAGVEGNLVVATAATGKAERLDVSGCDRRASDGVTGEGAGGDAEGGGRSEEIAAGGSNEAERVDAGAAI